MKRRHTKLRVFLIILSALFAFIIADIIISSNFLTVSSYKINTKKTKASFRAVVISDLHSKEFGAGNRDLINKIKEQSPDVIFTLGDMMSRNDDFSAALNLYSRLTEICGVYSCLGNHEYSCTQTDLLKEKMKSTGICLLENDMTTLSVGGGSVTVGSLKGFPYYENQAPDYENENRYFLDDFISQEKKNYSVLLVHQPEFYMWGLKDKDIDLMLCGHTHGGIIRLPFIGGLIAPNQGVLKKNGELLPQYTKGFYSSGTADMIVSAGLGNSNPIPRFNNPPEIVVLDFNR